MELVILLIVMIVLGAFTIKCMKREDSIIELEDKIIADLREFINSDKKSSKNTSQLRIAHRNESAHNRAA
ncbi:MAG: hypothetical protein ACI4F5_05380 [Acutalibacteraceae bacterium]